MLPPALLKQSATPASLGRQDETKGIDGTSRADDLLRSAGPQLENLLRSQSIGASLQSIGKTDPVIQICGPDPLVWLAAGRRSWRAFQSIIGRSRVGERGRDQQVD